MNHKKGPPKESEGAPHHQGQPSPSKLNNHHVTGSPQVTARETRGPGGTLGAFAVGLAGADLPVLPLLPRTKRPRYRGGYKAATCDTSVIAQHWATHPRDNIGVRPPLGMVVLDIDPRHGGDARMRELVDRHGRLPTTWTARTGGGGWHYWFVVGELEPVAHLCPGVDVKHGGTGFVVAPPSIHPGGDHYEWLTPPVDDPAMAPDWLRGLLQPPVYIPRAPTTTAGSGHGQYGLPCLIARIGRAPAGRRNTIVYGALRDAAAQGDLDAFEPDLIAAGQAIGLPAAEVDRIARSVRGGTR